MEFAGEVGQGAGEGGQDPQPVSVGWGRAAEGLCSRGAAAAAQTRTHTYTGRRDDITTWLCVSYLGPFNYYYYYYFSFPFLQL